MLDADDLDLTPVPAPPTRRRARRRTIGVLVVLVLAVLALLSQGLLHSLNYFETVDQALSARAKLGTQTFRLEGVVKPHTIERTASGASFWITGGDSKEVFVDAHGSPPQLFQAEHTGRRRWTLHERDVGPLRRHADSREAHGGLHRRAPQARESPQRDGSMTLTWLGRAALYLCFIGAVGGIAEQALALRAHRPSRVAVVGGTRPRGNPRRHWRHGVRARDPQLRARLRRGEQRDVHAAALFDHRTVVGPRGLTDALGAPPERAHARRHPLLPARARQSGRRLGGHRAARDRRLLHVLDDGSGRPLHP